MNLKSNPYVGWCSQPCVQIPYSDSRWCKIEVFQLQTLQNYSPFLYPMHILDFNYWKNALHSSLAPRGHGKQRDLSKQW